MPWWRGIEVIASAYRTEDSGFESRQGVRFLGICSGGVAQWTLHPPQEQEDPGSNPARV
jgi:hypothetical protein